MSESPTTEGKIAYEKYRQALIDGHAKGIRSSAIEWTKNPYPRHTQCYADWETGWVNAWNFYNGGCESDE